LNSNTPAPTRDDEGLAPTSRSRIMVANPGQSPGCATASCRSPDAILNDMVRLLAAIAVDGILRGDKNDGEPK